MSNGLRMYASWGTQPIYLIHNRPHTHKPVANHKWTYRVAGQCSRNLDDRAWATEKQDSRTSENSNAKISLQTALFSPISVHSRAIEPVNNMPISSKKIKVSPTAVMGHPTMPKRWCRNTHQNEWTKSTHRSTVWRRFLPRLIELQNTASMIQHNTIVHVWST